MAFGTGFGCAALGRAGTAAIRTTADTVIADLLLYAESGLFKGDADPCADIVSAHRAVAPRRRRTAESAAEEGTENISEIAKAAKTCAACTAAGGRIKGRMTVLVIFGAFVAVRKDIIGLVDLFEFHLGFFVAGIHIGVILLCQRTIGFFDRCFIGIFFDTQYLVIVFFICHGCSLLLCI